MTLAEYPKRILDDEIKYIYLIRIDVGNRFIYKIGLSRNLISRLATFRSHWWCPVDLLAYGCCRKARDVEFELHSLLFDRYHLSFMREMLDPYWSNEFFKFDYDGILEAIELIKERCFVTIVSPHFQKEIV